MESKREIYIQAADLARMDWYQILETLQVEEWDWQREAEGTAKIHAPTAAHSAP